MTPVSLSTGTYIFDQAYYNVCCTCHDCLAIFPFHRKFFFRKPGSPRTFYSLRHFQEPQFFLQYKTFLQMNDFFFSLGFSFLCATVNLQLWGKWDAPKIYLNWSTFLKFNNALYLINNRSYHLDTLPPKCQGHPDLSWMWCRFWVIKTKPAALLDNN